MYYALGQATVPAPPAPPIVVVEQPARSNWIRGALLIGGAAYLLTRKKPLISGAVRSEIDRETSRASRVSPIQSAQNIISSAGSALSKSLSALSGSRMAMTERKRKRR